MQRVGAVMLCCAVCCTGVPAAAQPAGGSVEVIAGPLTDRPIVQLIPVATRSATVAIPALTPVEIEVLATLGSKTSRTGDTFPIRLSKPIVIAGRVLVPAGTGGIGEVVHAKKSSGSGAGGELIVAARYLEVDGRRMRLRSMQLSTTGRDQTQLAMASSAALSLFALAITGKNTQVPAGIHATAKLAEDFIQAASSDADGAEGAGDPNKSVQQGEQE